MKIRYYNRSKWHWQTIANYEFYLEVINKQVKKTPTFVLINSISTVFDTKVLLIFQCNEKFLLSMYFSTSNIILEWINNEYKQNISNWFEHIMQNALYVYIYVFQLSTTDSIAYKLQSAFDKNA